MNNLFFGLLFQKYRKPPAVPQRVKYANFMDLKKDLQRLPTPWVVVTNTYDEVKIGFLETDSFTKYVIIHSSLTAEVTIRGRIINDLSRSIEDVALCHFLDLISKTKLCHGITSPDLMKRVMESEERFSKLKKCVFSNVCLVVVDDKVCKNCREGQKVLRKRHLRIVASNNKPVHQKTPLTTVKSNKLRSALKKCRERITAMQREIQRKGKLVPQNMHSTLYEHMENAVDIPEFTKLFWKEQKKAFGRSKVGMRWHPMLLR